MSEYPKVLVISHNVLCNTSNMGKTLLSWFEAWPEDKLCQLYFHSEVPTTDRCVQYFRITDVDIVSSLLRFTKPGCALTEKDIELQRADSRMDTGLAAGIYQAGRQRKPWMIWGRNLLWKLGTWKTKQLDEWIKECAPDVILFASGDYVFAYNVARYISAHYGIPMITAVFDDFYLYRGTSRSILARYNTRIFKSVMRKTMQESADACYIHPEMKRRYDEVFGTDGKVLYTSSEPVLTAEPDYDPIRISYFGGLGLKRDDALLEIGEALQKTVPDASVLLDIYSAEQNPAIVSKLTAQKAIRFNGSLDADSVRDREEQSNILVIAESKAPELLERLRFSLSTKTAEYLASNRCILAYGPAEAGVIKYLKDNNVACVVTDKTEIEDKLRSLISSKEVRESIAAKQLELAVINHSAKRNQEMLRTAICVAAGKIGE